MRCPWAVGSAMIAYHDQEWGRPVHDDRLLFELLILEGAQAGLSWSTILNKRAAYRQAFHQFELQRVAAMTERNQAELLQNPGIVRNRLKISSTIDNARAALKVQQEFGSLDCYFWQFVDGRPIHNAWVDAKQIPARTELSDRLSRDLKQRGFRFIGSTICYAFLQAVGLVDDHLISCHVRTTSTST